MTNPADGGPILDANGDPVITFDESLAADPIYRQFMSGRVPAECGHYIAASESRAGSTTCERCPSDQGGEN
jgi:hypothetical protein